jgi:hypothetical protein
MSIQSATRIAQYTGNGVASTFAVSFVFYANSHIVVTKETIADGATETLALTTDYTLTGAGNLAGGTLTLVAGALSAAYRLTIERVVPITQLTDYVNNDAFVADAHEKQMDLLVMMIQQLADRKSINFPAGELIAANTTLSDPVTRAGKLIYFNATTGALEEIALTDLKALLNALP